MQILTIDLHTVVLMLFLAVVVPIWGIRDFRDLLRRIEAGDTGARLRFYRKTLVWQWVLTAILLAWWLLAGGTAEAGGLLPAAEGRQWWVVGLGLAMTVFLVLQMRTVVRSPEQLEQMHRKMGELSGLAPQSPAEDRAFVAVSVTAGICEEILYRGLLLAVLSVSMGTWPAVLLSSVIFGLGHAYQGWTGFLRTGAVGLVLAALLVFTGSLYVPMLVHAVLDITSGRMMGVACRTASTRPATEGRSA